MTDLGIGPNYSVKFYRDGFYKLVRYNRPLVPHLPGDFDPLDDGHEDRGQEGKFSQSLSRARSVITQVVICNDWQYFATFTIDRSKYDRYNLPAFYKAFTQWIRDQRKKYGIKLQYAFVPELHEDGAWHLHGVVRGLPDDMVCPFVRGFHPKKLVDGGFLNWPAYANKFGFCSLAPIRDPVAVGFYVTKYISKDMERSVCDFGAHTYYCSIGLNRAVPMGYVYGRFAVLDCFLSYSGEFCSTGFVSDVDWSFWCRYILPDSEFDSFDYLEELPPVLTNVDISDLQLSLYDLYPDFNGEKYCV